jgi:hypothetical protein
MVMFKVTVRLNRGQIYLSYVGTVRAVPRLCVLYPVYINVFCHEVWSKEEHHYQNQVTINKLNNSSHKCNYFGARTVTHWFGSDGSFVHNKCMLSELISIRKIYFRIL